MTVGVVEDVDPLVIAHWLSTGQVSHRAKISSVHVRRLIDAGKLDAVRTRFGRLISPESLNAWLASRPRKRRR